MGKDYIFFGLVRVVSKVWKHGEGAEKVYKAKRDSNDVLKDERGVGKDHVQ